MYSDGNWPMDLRREGTGSNEGKQAGRQATMTTPEKPGEPSMEEILASIRQIIADDPGTDKPAIDPNPFVPTRPVEQKLAAAKAAETRSSPLVDRLNGVLKNGPLPPTSPFGSKKPSSFDQDLADFFEGEAPSPATAA